MLHLIPCSSTWGRGSCLLGLSLLLACALKTAGELPVDGSSEGCGAGLIPCGTSCIDPATDRLNCGGCGIVCDVTEQCGGGACVCPDPFEVCGGVCINTRIDRRHCGGCDHACDALASCTGGLCDCPAGYEDCGGECVDLNTDNENCGSCGNACTGGAFCNGTGSCALECSYPYTLCNPGADAYCADLENDPFNCSACGAACPSRDHSIPTCNAGTCGISCDVGFGNADGDPENGCECQLTNPSELCDAVDNDCNGSTDETFECILGTDRDCTLIASCAGRQHCGDDCSWGSCRNEAWDCVTPGTVENQDCGAGDCGTQARSCTESCDWTDWGSCDLRTGSECFEGATQDCGDCGSRTCTSGCDWGSCDGQGCHPGSTQTCGNCGSQTCSASCTWGTCGGQGCRPGDTRACGNCGTGTQTCSSSCTWGTCSGGGVCSPGATQSQDCGNCGTQTRTCTASCTWGSWSACTGEGECSPGDAQIQDCGNCGTQTRTCTGTCTWSGWSSCAGEGACAPGDTRCCNSNAGHQTCNASCAWNACVSCDHPRHLCCSDGEECCQDTCGNNCASAS